MGCFGYICKYCGSPIRHYEKCTMIHIRHSKELGRVTGSYDSYGRVYEQEGLPEDEKFRGDSDNKNNHFAICDSEFNLPDSAYLKKTVEKRLYGNKYCNFYTYLSRVLVKELKEHKYDLTSVRIYSLYSSLRPDLFVSLLRRSEEICKGSNKGLRDLLKAGFANDMECLAFHMWKDLKSCNSVYYQDFQTLKLQTYPTVSGLVVYHEVCYKKAEREDVLTMEPSEQDPNQSWGPSRKKFM